MRRARKIKADPEQAADREAVRRAAVALLAGRDFSSGELRARLAGQGYDGGTTGEVVEELMAGGVLNDARYCEHYIAYHAERGQGPVRIAADLKSLGLSAELIDTALESGPSWPSLAREVRIRKFGLAPPVTWAEKGRQARFLQYRGFSSDHIRAALGGDFDPDEPS